MFNDDTELPDTDDVDLAYYGKVIYAGLERPPRDFDEPRIWTLIDNKAPS
jgi:hypothetical protein